MEMEMRRLRTALVATALVSTLGLAACNKNENATETTPPAGTATTPPATGTDTGTMGGTTGTTGTGTTGTGTTGTGTTGTGGTTTPAQ
uniref:NlpE N-terminal domain protein n=2 Tax=Aureimonas frigidaquae TaxID=424757 RepID=A0A0P0Z476_9HYPH|nr:NlpE N-terminal domain protein [Aureimonas frigidaquae]